MHPTRIFKEPEELEKAWKEYKEHLKIEATNWPKVQYVGKDGDRKEDYPVLPYTMEGFSVYCYERHGVIREYFLNRGNYYDDFNTICAHIKEEIRHHQITGGLLGQFNPSITQRLNNLVEKTENRIEIEQPLFTDVPKNDSNKQDS